MRLRIRSGVYQAINEVNGKSYVGSSINVDNRWSAHRRDAKDPNYPTRSIFYAAIQKYGIENFTFLVLEECETTKAALLEREQFYIDLLEPEYNILPTAGSRLGSKSSPETIEKLRSKRHTEEWKLAASIRATEYMSQPEIKIKYSELRKGKTFAEIF